MASKCASKTLFVGNLHASLEENDLLEIFKPFGRIIECCKRWCHYGFIQFATEDEAKLAFDNLNGSKVRGRPMRIEFQRKKLRNIQALLDAETDTQINFNDQLSFFGLGNNENMNPVSYSIYDSANQEDEIMFSQNEMEKCLLRVFDDILVEDNLKLEITSKKGADILKSIKTENSDNTKNCANRPVLADISSKNEQSILDYNSLSSSCSSPSSQKEDISPQLDNSVKSSKSTSVRLFRSINSSNSIYVQPTDIIIPLGEGDYNEYKLFPASNYNQEASSQPQTELEHHSTLMDNILNNLGLFEGKLSSSGVHFYSPIDDELELYSPPCSSVSSVYSYSKSSSLASSPVCNSPVQKQQQSLKYLMK